MGRSWRMSLAAVEGLPASVMALILFPIQAGSCCFSCTGSTACPVVFLFHFSSLLLSFKICLWITSSMKTSLIASTHTGHHWQHTDGLLNCVVFHSGRGPALPVTCRLRVMSSELNSNPIFWLFHLCVSAAFSTVLAHC